VALSHVLTCFPILILSPLDLVIYRHQYLTHMKFDSRNFQCYESNTSFSSHLPFRFILEENKSCLQTLRRFYEVTSFLGYPLVETIFYENQDGICFL
jgi:hypothetical protein